MFWIFAVAIALISALLAALPLLVRRQEHNDAVGPNDAEVYRDQLSEIGRDEQSGLIDREAALQARAEVGRRLIAADRATPLGDRSAGAASTIALAAFLCLILPAGGLALYARMGVPEASDFPLQARFNSPDPDANILIRRAELRLEEHPEDGRGWEVLAPIYLANGRVTDAVAAWRNAIKTLGPDARRYGGLAETLVVANQGQVTAETREAFAKVLELVPGDPRARFYLALADGQDGKLDEALAKLEALKKDSPADAPWIGVTDDQIARIRSQQQEQARAPGNPTEEDVAAASELSDDDRAQMIRTMVESLDSRLKDDPDNIEGWKRLIRSYSTLQQPDKAGEALQRGLAVFPADSENGKALIALGRELGVSEEGRTE
ncbi:MAG: c-type cytochrome biogenesis protein CcmI [Rhizobium sp.]|nr:c-type cytochrome biogenesis protein CcmI [Rhizobium sp.]